MEDDNACLDGDGIQGKRVGIGKQGMSHAFHTGVDRRRSPDPRFTECAVEPNFPKKIKSPLKAQELMRRRQAEKQRRAEEAAVRAREMAERQEAEQAQRRQEAPSELLPLWDRALERLRQTVAGPSFAAHIASLIPIRREGDTITLRAASAFARDWVLRRHGEALNLALSTASGGNVEVAVTCEKGHGGT
jgi:hypothetical protein